MSSLTNIEKGVLTQAVETSNIGGSAASIGRRLTPFKVPQSTILQPQPSIPSSSLQGRTVEQRTTPTFGSDIGEDLDGIELVDTDGEPLVSFGAEAEIGADSSELESDSLSKESSSASKEDADDFDVVDEADLQMPDSEPEKQAPKMQGKSGNSRYDFSSQVSSSSSLSLSSSDQSSSSSRSSETTITHLSPAQVKQMTDQRISDLVKDYRASLSKNPLVRLWRGICGVTERVLAFIPDFIAFKYNFKPADKKIQQGLSYELSFVKRTLSLTAIKTPGDGSCGLWSIAMQLCCKNPSKPTFSEYLKMRYDVIPAFRKVIADNSPRSQMDPLTTPRSVRWLPRRMAEWFLNHGKKNAFSHIDPRSWMGISRINNSDLRTLAEKTGIPIVYISNGNFNRFEANPNKRIPGLDPVHVFVTGGHARAAIPTNLVNTSLGS